MEEGKGREGSHSDRREGYLTGATNPSRHLLHVSRSRMVTRGEGKEGGKEGRREERKERRKEGR